MAYLCCATRHSDGIVSDGLPRNVDWTLPVPDEPFGRCRTRFDSYAACLASSYVGLLPGLWGWSRGLLSITQPFGVPAPECLTAWPD